MDPRRDPTEPLAGVDVRELRNGSRMLAQRRARGFAVFVGIPGAGLAS